MRMLHSSMKPLTLGLILSAATAAPGSWEVRSTHTDILIGLDFVSAETGWVVGAANGIGPVIKRTDDGGANWVYQSTDMTNMYWMDVDMATRDEGWCNGLVAFVGRQSVNHTDDGGQNWEGQVATYNIAAWLDMFALDATHAWSSGMWVILLQDHEGLLRTTDGGGSWQAHEWGMPEPARFVHFVDANHGWMSGGHWPESSVAGGGIRTYRPSQYSPIAWPMPTEVGRPDINDQTYGCLIARTSDGGQNFDEVFTSEDYYPNHIEFVNRNEGWMAAEGAAGTYILHTRDGGESWTQQLHELQSELISLADIHMFNRREGWAVGFGSTGFGNPEVRFLHTLDGGENWVADPFATNVGPLHMSWVDESSGFSVGSNNLNTSKVLGYADSARQPQLGLRVLNAPETAGGNDTIRWDVEVGNRTGSAQAVDAWLQVTGPRVPGYSVDMVLKRGIVVPPHYRGTHRITVQLPGALPGIYGFETILGPAHNEDPLVIKAYDTFSLEVLP